MVMITLTDRGFYSSDVALRAQQPVMFMVVNRGARPQSIHAALPLTRLQIDDPAQPAAGPTTALAEGFDVTVAGGCETDVTFTPTLPGRYGLTDGLVNLGALVVS